MNGTLSLSDTYGGERAAYAASLSDWPQSCTSWNAARESIYGEPDG